MSFQLWGRLSSLLFLGSPDGRLESLPHVTECLVRPASIQLRGGKRSSPARHCFVALAMTVFRPRITECLRLSS